MSNATRAIWTCAAALAVFVVWLLADSSANAGIAFFYAVPVGMASWWWGRRGGAIAVAGCTFLYVLGVLVEPVPHIGLALSARVLAFIVVATVVSILHERFVVLQHSAELLTLANQALADRPGRAKELVSAACLRFRSQDATLSWAVAGHPLPLHLPSLRELEPPGPTQMLGFKRRLVLANAELRLGEQEGVLVYTDGATDVRRGDALLGIEGLERLLSPLTGLPAEALIARFQEALLEWADEPVRDDLCLVALKPEG